MVGTIATPVHLSSALGMLNNISDFGSNTELEMVTMSRALSTMEGCAQNPMLLVCKEEATKPLCINSLCASPETFHLASVLAAATDAECSIHI